MRALSNPEDAAGEVTRTISTQVFTRLWGGGGWFVDGRRGNLSDTDCVRTCMAGV